MKLNSDLYSRGIEYVVREAHYYKGPQSGVELYLRQAMNEVATRKRIPPYKHNSVHKIFEGRIPVGEDHAIVIKALKTMVQYSKERNRRRRVPDEDQRNQVMDDKIREIDDLHEKLVARGDKLTMLRPTAHNDVLPPDSFEEMRHARKERLAAIDAVLSRPRNLSPTSQAAIVKAARKARFDLGFNVRRLRVDKTGVVMDLGKVAEITGIPKDRISRAEAGCTVLDEESMLKILEALEATEEQRESIMGLHKHAWDSAPDRHRTTVIQR